MAALSPESEAAQIADAELALTGKTVKTNAMTLAGGRARREPAALVLTLDDGKSLRLDDGGKCDPPDEQRCPSYKLAAFLPSHGIFLVEKDEFEGYDLVLVEMANGRQHTIDGPPHYSPDGTRFLTCRVDEMNGGGTTMWRVAAGRYVQEWQDERMSVCGRWKSNDAVEVGVYDDVPSGTPRPLSLVRKGAGWELRDGKGVLKARP